MRKDGLLIDEAGESDVGGVQTHPLTYASMIGETSRTRTRRTSLDGHLGATALKESDGNSSSTTLESVLEAALFLPRQDDSDFSSRSPSAGSSAHNHGLTPKISRRRRVRERINRFLRRLGLKRAKEI